ncbi:MAG: 1-acyl-sn-glycerol-3-phosphate acyltransferase [Verrucomicrobiales bacterium]|nr:1-acyl-sn-glycerol-3-phosphate acyltransferase [Verrucomicrobiales bacterium]
MSGAFRHPLRIGLRLGLFLGINSAGLVDHLWRLRRVGKGSDPRSCAHWLQRWSRNTLRGIGIQYSHQGRVPTHGLIVSNHLGYLDIPVLATTGPMVFVSKADVERWPFLGSLARCGGTLFLKREQRSHVAEIADSFAPIVEGGTVVAIFPEGTSSGGDTILPFRSSLLQPAASHRWPVTPAWISYELEPGDGAVADDVAYWREMTFAPHFAKLLSKRVIRARVRYGEPIEGVDDRKVLTARLYEAVCALKAEGDRERAAR